jgi:YidC/Oxa1 family membrane protein insertase
LSRIRELHKGDNKRQQEEIMKIYKEHGVNPAAGCLPLVIQFPIIWSLYHVLHLAVSVTKAADLSHINNAVYFDFLKLQQVWNTSFFGLPLGVTPSKMLATAPLIILIPVITGLLQFVLSKMMLPEEELVPAVTDKKKGDDFQAAFQKQSLLIFPVMIGFFSFTFPLGLSLYWNTYTIFGILQQYLLIGPGAAKPYFERVRRRKAEETKHGRRK